MYVGGMRSFHTTYSIRGLALLFLIWFARDDIRILDFTVIGLI